MALLLRSPVWWTVVSPALGIPEPSLPFVTLNRWMENLEASAILLNICDAGASDSMVMDSGRPLIGRPEGYVSSVLVGVAQSSVVNWRRQSSRTSGAHDKCYAGRRHCAA
jgi:hypothetical protein